MATDQNISPNNAGDSDAFENIFNQAGPTIDPGARQVPTNEPTPAPTQAGDSGDPEPSGNQEPTQQGQQGGNQQAANTQNGPAEGQQPSDQETAPQNPDELQPKDDPERWQYWQSRADKAAAELDKFRSQIEAQNPVISRINENPELAQKVYGLIQEHQQQGPQGSSPNSQQQMPQQAQVNLPERPEKPQKPSDYDPMDAVSDTTSASYKYREAMEEYNEQLAEYNEQLVNAQTERQQLQEQQRQQAIQRNQQMRELYNEAVYRHGLQPQEAASFINWAKEPNYDVADLIAVYRQRNEGSRQAQRQAQNVQGRNERLQTPVPPVSQGNATTPQQEPTIDEDDPQQAGAAFTDSLFSAVGNR